MRTLAVAEAKDRFSELVAAAQAGEEIVITRHGKPAAKLVAAQDDARGRNRQVIDEMIALGKEMRAKYGSTPIADLIAWKNEGRL